MNAEEFKHLAGEMRAAQKEYFRTRSAAALEQSKRLERRLDDALRDKGQRELFPIGSRRVFDELQRRGFVMDKHDQNWKRADGMYAHVYGDGSRLAVYKDAQQVADAPTAEALERIDKLTNGG